MNVRVWPARSAADRRRAARRAADVLQRGGVVVHPTETVYGIGGDGTPENNAVIARLKRRDAERPLILLTPDLATLRVLLPGMEWPAEAAGLAERFWPGPLTLIVRCRDAPRGLRGPDGGVAVRVTAHPTLEAIFAEWKRPLTSTSANLSGAPAAKTVDAALALFRGRDDLEELNVPVMAVDGGPALSRPSTIVTLSEAPPRLLRAGPVRYEELKRVLPALQG